MATGRVDRETVVRVAADLADAQGWEALTMSQVARELDRHVSSLYAHVDSLATLRREVAILGLDELTDAVYSAAIGKVGGEALQAIADVYLDYARRHPGRSAVMAQVRRADGEAAVRGARLAEAVRATFRSFGLDDERAAVAHHVFSAMVIGFAPRHADDDLAPAVSLFVTALETGRWP